MLDITACGSGVVAREARKTRLPHRDRHGAGYQSTDDRGRARHAPGKTAWTSPGMSAWRISFPSMTARSIWSQSSGGSGLSGPGSRPRGDSSPCSPGRHIRAQYLGGARPAGYQSILFGKRRANDRQRLDAHAICDVGYERDSRVTLERRRHGRLDRAGRNRVFALPGRELRRAHAAKRVKLECRQCTATATKNVPSSPRPSRWI